MTMQVVNRKGEREDVRFDAILEKLSSLTEGLDANWVDPAQLTKLTIEGLYDGVSTRELDQLAAETAASLASHHPECHGWPRPRSNRLDPIGSPRSGLLSQGLSHPAPQ